MNWDDIQRGVRWRLIIFLVGLASLLFILDTTGNMDNAFRFIRDPISIVMDWTAGRTDSFANVFAGPREIQEARVEIEALQLRVAELERENEELREIQGEYQLLQELFDRTRDTPQLSRQIANVIGRDTSPFFRSIIIDKGSNDGVFVGMPVESARGLVGRVYRTTGSSAQVLLISDNLSAIPSRLVDSRATGIVRGDGLNNSMQINWVSLEAELAIGELVLTSGLGGVFPADLIMGRVTQVQRGEAELFQSATVQPAADFERLEVVFVIINFEPTDTTVFDVPGQ